MIDLWPHFIRPDFIYALPLLALALFLVLKIKSSDSFWQRYLPKQFQSQLLNVKDNQKAARAPKIAMSLFLICGFIALLGPSWIKQEVPTQNAISPLSMVIDLSPNINQSYQGEAALSLMKRKVHDLLEQRDKDATGLIAYSGTAHTIVPMTVDQRTIENMLPAVNSQIMPVQGTNASAGIKASLKSLEKENGLMDAAQVQGSILLMTTGFNGAQISQIQTLMAPFKKVHLFILGINPAPQQESALTELAQRFHGNYQAMTLNDQDLKQLQIAEHQLMVQGENQIQSYQDQGYFFIIPMMLFALFLLRRHWLLCVPFLFLLGAPKAHAMNLDTLLYNADQRAQMAIENGDYAAGLNIRDPNWKAYAQYELGDYAQAESVYEQDHSANGFYNYGNSLAKQQKYQEALAAWDKALEIRLDFPEALKNKALVEALLNQQEEEQEQNQGDQNNNDESQKNGDQNQNQNQKNEDKNQDSNQDNSSDSEQNQNNNEQDDSANDQSESSTDENGEEETNQDQQDDDQTQTDQNQQAGNEEENASKDQNKSEQEESNDNNQDNNEQQQTQDEAVNAEEAQEEADQEKKEYLEQLLEAIPDQAENSANLLKRKFYYEYKNGTGD